MQNADEEIYEFVREKFEEEPCQDCYPHYRRLHLSSRRQIDGRSDKDNRTPDRGKLARGLIKEARLSAVLPAAVHH
jgi:hypothetical protein